MQLIQICRASWRLEQAIGAAGEERSKTICRGRIGSNYKIEVPRQRSVFPLPGKNNAARAGRCIALLQSVSFAGRKEMWETRRSAALCFGAAYLSSGTAYAIDIYPGDYTVLPAGSNLALMYGGHVRSRRLNVKNAGDVPDSRLQATLGIARYVRYEDIGGIPVVAEAILPFGGYHDVRIGGVSQSTRNGLGDLLLGFAAFPVHKEDPRFGTTLGFTAYLALPTGAYDPAKVSFGTGAYTFTPQIGLIQGLGKGLVLDAAADAAFTVNHMEKGVRYGVKPSYQLQAYLRQSISATATLSFGYSGRFGGAQKIDGLRTGLETSNHQLRLFLGNFFTKTFQVQAVVGGDIASRSGFRQGINSQIRLLKLF
ncbi:transporter [Sphingomonas sp.]|uniref:transporter n=1 Tax=Sphingomonas sp. TaxID=28214 RepID=UPI0025FB5160|nr:transporter [Sphingomonas sp.]